MKINEKNKRAAYNRFMVRSGIGLRMYCTKSISQYSKDQMHHKPYGGIYESKHPDTAEQI